MNTASTIKFKIEKSLTETAMPAVLESNCSTLSEVITLKRDDCHVIYRKFTTPEARESAFEKLRRIVKSMPTSDIDTVDEVRQIRDSGGNF